MRSLGVALIFLGAVSVQAQVVSRPTDPPIVTAENDSWYRLREPVQFAGEDYFPAGATVFFNGNTMVRTGHYNGVPLYADATLEPYSIVYVPIGRGVMQPYERARSGDLAGTSGSRTPSFPTRAAAERRAAPVAVTAVSPTAPPRPLGAVSAFTPEAGAIGTTGMSSRGATTIVGTAGTVTVRQAPPTVAAIERGQSSDGIWLEFMGGKWVSAGPAVPLRASEFMRVGDYAGFPVFARHGLTEEIVYLPTLAGYAAPYRLKQ
jgi:hypothetical protein